MVTTKCRHCASWNKFHLRREVNTDVHKTERVVVLERSSGACRCVRGTNWTHRRAFDYTTDAKIFNLLIRKQLMNLYALEGHQNGRVCSIVVKPMHDEEQKLQFGYLLHSQTLMLRLDKAGTAHSNMLYAQLDLNKKGKFGKHFCRCRSRNI